MGRWMHLADSAVSIKQAFHLSSIRSPSHSAYRIEPSALWLWVGGFFAELGFAFML